MNRRAMLAMIPLLPAAVALSHSGATVVEAAPLDMRPTFRREDYVLVTHGGSGQCLRCGDDHGPYYTVECGHPAAFLPEQVPYPRIDEMLDPVGLAARPYGVYTAPVVGDDALPLQWSNEMPLCDIVGPHTHERMPVRWA